MPKLITIKTRKRSQYPPVRAVHTTGRQWSFNPLAGLVYIPTTASSSFDYTELKDFVYRPGRQNLGFVFGIGGAVLGGGTPGARVETPPSPPPPTGKTLAAIGPAAPEGQRGMLVAWDPVAQ